MAENYEEICPYCKNTFSKHTRSRHEVKCFLKPENGKLLAKFLLNGLENINLISWTNTYRFTIRNKISTSSTIIIQTDSEGWTPAVIKLMLLFYENKIIDDFELYDLIIGKLSHWTYFDSENFEKARKDYSEKLHNVDLVDSIPYENYEKLIFAIITRAIMDYKFLLEIEQDAFEEDGFIIEREECLSIIELWTPLIYQKLIEEENNVRSN